MTRPKGFTYPPMARDRKLVRMLEDVAPGWVTIDLIRAALWPDSPPPPADIEGWLRWSFRRLRVAEGPEIVRRVIRITAAARAESTTVTLVMYRLADGLPKAKGPSAFSLTAWQPEQLPAQEQAA